MTNGAPATTATSAAQSKRRHFNQLNRAVAAASQQLASLAYLGRPGLWVLHHEDLYRLGYDTRPQSRDPSREIPLDLPGLREGTIWDGTGPTPDFQDVAFWEAQHKHLTERVDAVTAGNVQPRFSPADLAALEALEQQPDHVFCMEAKRQQQVMHDSKDSVFKLLFKLAQVGRPGQWILHNADIYHPAIDTHPGSRADRTSIVIRDSTFDGSARFLGDGRLTVDFEVTWAGTLPAPDFADPTFWKLKSKELVNKLIDAEEGRVQPHFTPEELQTLERLEADPDHAFGILAREARENPAVVETPEMRELTKSLFVLRSRCINHLEYLWDHGLAGKWVVHNQDLYVPKFDIHCRDRNAENGQEDSEDNDAADFFLVDSDLDLRIDTRFKPAPHGQLGTVAYWEHKKAQLDKLCEDARAGRLKTHHFSQGELMRIELLDRALEQEMEELGGSESESEEDPSGIKKTKKIAAWLNGATDRSAAAAASTERPKRSTRPKRQQTPRPPPFISHSPSPVVEQRQQAKATQATRKRKAVTQAVPQAATQAAPRKRKRAADGDKDEDEKHQPPPQVLGRGTRSAKRSKGREPTTRHTLKERKEQTQQRGGAERSTTITNNPLRRSARIAAQAPKGYR